MKELPKRISFFWSGRMSWLRYLTLHSFRRLNPDWEIRLYSPIQPCGKKTWTSFEDGDGGYRGVDYTERVTKLNVQRNRWVMPFPNLAPAHACDLFQWQLLGTEGGFYADMDIVWLKPLEPLRQKLTDRDAVFCLERGMMAIGFFASMPGCPLFRDLYAYGVSQGRVKGYQDYGSLLMCGFAALNTPVPDTPPPPGIMAVDQLRIKYPTLKLEVLPDEVVYPFDWEHIPDIFEKNRGIPVGSYGLHWFGGSPDAKRWRDRLTPANYRRHTTTLTRCIVP